MQKAQGRGMLQRLEKNPPRFFLIGYLLLIFIGAFLLMLPMAYSGEGKASPVIAVFTATSAVCVTGLSPVVTQTFWTPFGQTVILALIQVGGLGIVTAMALFGFLINRRFTMSSRLLMREEKNQSELTGMVKLIRFILLATFGIELMGIFLLSIRFVPLYGWQNGVYAAIFHSISAFCNAGFDLIGPDSLVPFQRDAYVLLTIAALIIVSGLGYTVYLDLITHKKGRRFRLHTKIALSATLALLIGGTLLFYFGEASNGATLGHLSQPDRWLNAFFQSVTTRTAGFFAIPQNALQPVGLLTTLVLMFIGGSPMGTAGGLKTTTTVVLLLGAVSELRNAPETPVFQRNFPRRVTRSAFILFLLSLLWVLIVVMLLSFTEQGKALGDLFFEVISAYGTVGLTRGITGSLSSVGSLLVALTMLFGKLGPLTLLHALIPTSETPANRLAEESILVG